MDEQANKEWDLEGLVKEAVPEPITPDVETEKEGDARNILIENLREYHLLFEQVPENLRPTLAKVVMSALDYGADPSVDLYFKDSDLPGKYAAVLDLYHQRRGAEFPNLDEDGGF